MWRIGLWRKWYWWSTRLPCLQVSWMLTQQRCALKNDIYCSSRDVCSYPHSWVLCLSGLHHSARIRISVRIISVITDHLYVVYILTPLDDVQLTKAFVSLLLTLNSRLKGSLKMVSLTTLKIHILFCDCALCIHNMVTTVGEVFPGCTLPSWRHWRGKQTCASQFLLCDVS